MPPSFNQTSIPQYPGSTSKATSEISFSRGSCLAPSLLMPPSQERPSVRVPSTLGTFCRTGRLMSPQTV